MENFRLCRICISESAVMMSIFGEDALWRKIVSFADVLIEEDDILPQQICMICVKNAINAAEFKKKCEDADRYFRRQLQAAKVDVIVVSSDDEETCILPTEEDQYEDVKDFPLVTGDTPPPSRQIPLYSPKPPDTPTNPVPVRDVVAEIADPEKETATVVSVKNATKTSPSDKSIGHQCPICFDYFAMKTILKHHVKNKHPETETTYECFDCKRLYNSQRFLEKHIRTGKCKKMEKQQEKITHQMEFRCPTCRTSFPSGHHLGWHKRSGICAVFRIKRREKLAGISVRPLSTLIGSVNNVKTQNGESSLSDNGFTATNPGINTDQLQLDENQLALAKTLVLQNVNIHEMARQLNTSEMCAMRLRKSISGFYNRANNDGVDMKGNYSVEKSKTKDLVLQSFGPIKDNNVSGQKQDTEIASSPRPGGSQSTKIRIKLFKGREAEIVNNRNHPDDLKIKKSKISQSLRKPRKPSVFMDEEKYERAKLIVANNGTTTDVSQQLNISAMSAWKIRQCILKGVPLTFRKAPVPRRRLPPPVKPVMQRGLLKRPRLKGPDRIERDRQITNEILSLLKEDSTIQYWKMSDRLAEKGIHLTPPSICVKLKSMGIHRRWKANSNLPYDEPMIMNASASSKSDASTTELILPANSTI